MTDKTNHIAWAAEAVAVFQGYCRTGDDHAIADLICDLGHWLMSAASTFSARQDGALGIGTRNSMFKTAAISDRMPQSRSTSFQGSRDA